MADIYTLGLNLDGTQLRSEAARSTQSLNRMERAGSSLRSAMLQLGITISAGLLFRKIIQNTVAYQDAMAQLEARIKSTGGAAGKTVEELDAMARALQKTTTYGDEATKGAQALLLTFKAIRGETFDEALRATLDLATAMGTDLRSAALQVGKALEDPATQMSYLRRSGVSFTKEQIELARQLQETGRLAEAQALVLKELKTQFGGSAEAARNTLGGALAYVSNQWNDLFEVSTSASAGMIAALNSIGDVIPSIGAAIGAFFGGIQILAVDAAVKVGELELAFARLAEDEGIRGFATRLSGLGEGRGLLDPLGLDLFSKAVGADLGKSVSEAEAHLARLREAAEEVKNAIVSSGGLSEAFRRLKEEIENAAAAANALDAAKVRAQELAKALDLGIVELPEVAVEIADLGLLLKRLSEDEAQAMADRIEFAKAHLAIEEAILRVLEARQPLQAMSTIPGQAPTLGAAPVSARLSVEQGRQAYEEYVAWVDGLRDALDDSGPAWDAALRGVASMSDGLGMFREASRVAIRGISDIITGIKDIGAAGALATLGGIGGVIGGLATIAGGMFGGDGEDQRLEEERRRALEANTNALDRMREALEEITSRTAEDWSKLADAISAFGTWQAGGSFLQPGVQQGLDQWFGTVSVSMDDLLKIAEQLEIQIVDSAGRLIPGALDQLRERAELMAAQILENQERFNEELAVRRLLAEGQDEAAAALRMELRHREEYAAAVAAGYDEATLAELKHIQALEQEALAAQAAADAVAEAAAAMQRLQSYMADAYAMFGQGAMAGRVRTEAGYEQMLGREDLSEGERQVIEAMRDAARERWKREDQRDADIEEVNKWLQDQLNALDGQEAALRATLDTLNADLAIAREALRVAEDQLREQERAVEETRRVVEALDEYSQSLKLSGASTLSPTRQLVEARSQYDALLEAARGGDAKAAQQLPGAADALLQASRAVNASSTRYAADYEYVQATIGQIQEAFAGQLTDQEAMLTELKAQTDSLRAQIADMELLRDAAEANLDAVRDAADRAEASAREQIQAIEDEFAAADEIALEQLLQLIRIAQGTQALVDNTYRTDPEGGGQTFDIDLEPLNDGIGDVASNTAATVNALQGGFSAVVNRLEALEGAVLGVQTGVRRLEEAR